MRADREGRQTSVKDDGGGEDKVRQGRRRTKAARGRRRQGGEGGKEGRMEGRNGGTAEGEQRKKKLCELGHMTEDLHATRLKARCLGGGGQRHPMVRKGTATETST